MAEPSFYIHPQGNTDFELTQFGTEQCGCSQSFGPAIRDYYLLHYIVSGKGVYLDGKGRKHTLSSGHGFLISPFERTFYQADEYNPWRYVWIGFIGKQAEYYLNMAGLNPDHPTFYDPASEAYISRMIAAFEEINYELLIIAEFFRMIAHLTPPGFRLTLNTRTSVDKACEFIRNNIDKEIRIHQLAANLGYNHTYFCDLFKREKGMPPKAYLIKCRMELACTLLRNPQYQVSDIARSVGYENPFFFSRIFKNKVGMSPRLFRKSLQEIPR